MLQSKAENNRISFFVKVENLSRALRSCCSSGTEHIQVLWARRPTVPLLDVVASPACRTQHITHAAAAARHPQLKLTKKQGQPALSFEIHESAE